MHAGNAIVSVYVFGVTGYFYLFWNTNRKFKQKERKKY